MKFFYKALLVLLAALSVAEGSYSHHARRAHLRRKHRVRHHRTEGALVPMLHSLEAGNKAEFKLTLNNEAKHGGKQKIQEYLSELQDMGYSVKDIKNWLSSSEAPVPKRAQESKTQTEQLKPAAVQKTASVEVQPVKAANLQSKAAPAASKAEPAKAQTEAAAAASKAEPAKAQSEASPAASKAKPAKAQSEAAPAAKTEPVKEQPKASPVKVQHKPEPAPVQLKTQPAAAKEQPKSESAQVQVQLQKQTPKEQSKAVPSKAQPTAEPVKVQVQTSQEAQATSTERAEPAKVNLRSQTKLSAASVKDSKKESNVKASAAKDTTSVKVKEIVESKAEVLLQRKVEEEEHHVKLLEKKLNDEVEAREKAAEENMKMKKEMDEMTRMRLSEEKKFDMLMDKLDSDVKARSDFEEETRRTKEALRKEKEKIEAFQETKLREVETELSAEKTARKKSEEKLQELLEVSRKQNSADLKHEDALIQKFEKKLNDDVEERKHQPDNKELKQELMREALRIQTTEDAQIKALATQLRELQKGQASSNAKDSKSSALKDELMQEIQNGESRLKGATDSKISDLSHRVETVEVQSSRFKKMLAAAARRILALEKVHV